MTDFDASNKRRKIEHKGDDEQEAEAPPDFAFDQDLLGGELIDLPDLDLDLGVAMCELALANVTVTVISVEFTSEHRVLAHQVLRPSPAAITFTFRADAPDGQVHVRNTNVVSQLGAPTHAFNTPGWINDPVVNHNWTTPTSHTKNQNVTVTVVVRLHVPGDCHVNCSITRIVGVPVAGAHGLDFAADYVMPPAYGQGDHDITLAGLVSGSALDNEVKIVNESIDWTATVDGGAANRACAAGRTGAHRLYLTFGPPGGQVRFQAGFDLTAGPQDVTEERLAWAVNAIVAEHANVPNYDPDTEKHQVDAIFLRLATLGVDYRLGFRFGSLVDETFMEDAGNGNANPDLHHYLWMCNTDQAKGECHNIAAAFILACQIIGVVGAFDMGFIEPWPSRDDDPDNNHPRRQNDPLPCLMLNTNRPLPALTPAQNNDPWIKGKYSVDHALQYRRSMGRRANDGNVPFQHCAFVDGADFINNFEGAARYLGQYLYAIGDVILDSEASTLLNASVYYTLHNRHGGSRKVSRVHGNGKFRLVFCTSGGGVVDATPYRQTDGHDTIVYTNVVNVGSTFRWQD